MIILALGDEEKQALRKEIDKILSIQAGSPGTEGGVATGGDLLNAFMHRFQTAMTLAKNKTSPATAIYFS